LLVVIGGLALKCSERAEGGVELRGEVYVSVSAEVDVEKIFEMLSCCRGCY